MKRKYYTIVDGKLCECVFCNSCRTEEAGTFDCLCGQVPESLPYWCLILNEDIDEMSVHESGNEICL